MPHPFLGELAKTHLEELHAEAALRSRQRELRLRKRVEAVRLDAAHGRLDARGRAGWWLVTVGLRLATGSVDALR